jgi:FkbM family methyltransferase
VKNIVVKILKKLRIYGIACAVLLKWRSTPWERTRHYAPMLSFYSQFIRKGDLCFDVGANVGERTEVFRRLGSTVVAIEPQDVCVQQLVKRYGGNSKVKIVPKALGENEGEAEMMLSKNHWLSSLSKKWMDTAKASSLCIGYNWDRRVIVPVTTLDKLIADYGQPAFCKIDVEGFESEVLKGLSQPMRAVSIEFHTFLIDSAVDCINRLSSLGMIWYNYSLMETMVMNLERWVKADEMCDILRALPAKIEGDVYGDVYATSAPAPNGYATSPPAMTQQ